MIELIAGEHAVLLIHGLQSGPTEKLTLAKRLHKSGYTVRIPYFKGYGYTAGIPRTRLQRGAIGANKC